MDVLGILAERFTWALVVPVFVGPPIGLLSIWLEKRPWKLKNS